MAVQMRRLPGGSLGVKPWLAVAIVLMIAVLGYSSFLAVRFWRDHRQIESLAAQAQQLSVVLREGLPDVEGRERQLEAGRRELEKRQEELVFPGTTSLVGLLSSSAAQTGVELSSIVAGRPTRLTVADTLHDSLTVTVDVQGDAADILRFLSAVHRSAPVVSVDGFRIANLDGTPSALLELSFRYLPSDAGDAAEG